MVLHGDEEQCAKTPIQQFYANENIFVTGGTGFLGKVLIEKLLRSCPDINVIYVLIRPKKGNDVTQRMEIFCQDSNVVSNLSALSSTKKDKSYSNVIVIDINELPRFIFDKLRQQNVNFHEKIKPISGDVSLEDLGLSNEDRKLLILETTLIFNMAATIRFDEKLRTATAINIQGTKEMLKLSQQMANLKGMVHVSTAYSNCNRKEIEEKFYDPPISSDNLIKLVESSDDEKLEAMVPEMLGDFPNTYAFTKLIGEEIIKLNSNGIPLAVFRPAIVISAYKEPFEGWVDNYSGPTGAICGVGLGLIRILPIDKNCVAEMVPVDYTVNAMIAICWDLANNHPKNRSEPPIYNYHSTWNNHLEWGQYMSLALHYGKQMPTIKSMWCYKLTLINNVVLYYISIFLFHTLPAFLIDLGLILTRQEPKILKLYKKVHKYLAVTCYFSKKSWIIKNNNTTNLWNKLTANDKKLFCFSMYDFNWSDYMKKCIAGIRLYIFQDELGTVPVAKKRLFKFNILHLIIKYGCIGLIIYSLFLLYTKFSLQTI